MNDDFGFSVIKTIDYRVGFFNDKEKPISEEILYDLLMLKCAEFTLEKNSKYFEIINLMYADNGKFISEIYNFIDLHETEPKNSENRVYKAKKVIEYLCSKHKIKRACGE